MVWDWKAKETADLDTARQDPRDDLLPVRLTLEECAGEVVDLGEGEDAPRIEVPDEELCHLRKVPELHFCLSLGARHLAVRSFPAMSKHCPTLFAVGPEPRLLSSGVR